MNQISVNAKFATTQILRLKSGLKVKMKVTGGPPAIFRGGRDLLEYRHFDKHFMCSIQKKGSAG